MGWEHGASILTQQAVPQSRHTGPAVPFLSPPFLVRKDRHINHGLVQPDQPGASDLINGQGRGRELAPQEGPSQKAETPWVHSGA